jgi:hypothetical protein
MQLMLQEHNTDNYTDSQLGNIPTSVLDTDFTTTSNVVLSDLYVENAFLRMDNITLDIHSQNGWKLLRLFAGMQNICNTDYSGLILRAITELIIPYTLDNVLY